MIDFAISERPEKLSEFVGNNDVKNMIKKAIETNSLAQSILIYGLPSSGKTTLARIIKNELSVDDMDFVDVDCGINTGIDFYRDLVYKLQVPSITGGKRIVFLDECHRITLNVATFLLKTLEEPPKNVYFIFCTTDPEKMRKVSEAYYSRFTKYKLNPLTAEEIMNNIIRPCKQKYGIKLSKATAEKIAKKSSGMPRVALKLLYQIQNLSDEQQLDFIENFKTDDIKIMDIYKALIKQKGFEGYLNVMKLINDSNIDYEALRNTLIKIASNHISNPFNQDQLLDAFDMVDAFSAPCYDGAVAIIAKAVWLFIHRN